MSIPAGWRYLWQRWRGRVVVRVLAHPAPITDDATTTFPTEPPPERLARLANWCTDGRLAAAELELHEWQRADDCPIAARTLLAALLRGAGAADDALAILRRGEPARADVDADAELAQLHIAVLTTAGLTDSAAELFLRLHHEHGDDPAIAAWIQAVQVGASADLPMVPDRQIAHLAAELTVDPQVIPSLVAAQKAHPSVADLILLRRAVELLIHEVHDDHPQMLMVCQALAELALLGGDADDARAWAHRGLRINPFAASLAIVLSQVPADAAMGPTADLVLQGAIDAHPTYPDLRAAMVRYELAHGHADKARLFLEHWLSEQPDQPLARRLRKELAA